MTFQQLKNAYVDIRKKDNIIKVNRREIKKIISFLLKMTTYSILQRLIDPTTFQVRIRLTFSFVEVKEVTSNSTKSNEEKHT